MKQNWVIDASPLIILGKAELLETISALATSWLIPNGVIQEISQKSAVEPLLAQLSQYAEVKCKKVPVIKPQIIRWNLDDGESEVITLAIKNAGYGVVLDDLQARKCATVLNLSLIGSLGLIVKAKKEGLLKTVKPAFEKLMISGLYIDKVLIETVLTSLGEQ